VRPLKLHSQTLTTDISYTILSH